MTSREQHWQRLYQDKAPHEVTWYQADPRTSLQMIHATGVDKNADIIDVGGGTSVLVDRLLAEGFQRVSVLDISGQALARTRQRLGAAADGVRWLHTDATELQATAEYDLWHDRAVFHFLTEADDRRRYVEALGRALKSNGHVIMATFAVGGPTMCSGLNIVQYDSEKLCGELGSSFQLVEVQDEMHVTPAGKPQAFTYFRLLMQ